MDKSKDISRIPPSICFVTKLDIDPEIILKEYIKGNIDYVTVPVYDKFLSVYTWMDILNKYKTK